MDKNKEHKDKIYNELLNKKRKTFVYVKNDEYIAEVSLAFNKEDEDDTIPGKRYIFLELLLKKILGEYVKLIKK